MRTLGVPVVFVVLGFSIVGCNHLSSDGGSSPPLQAAPSATPNPPTWAANADDVTRFADEEPFGPAATIVGDSVRVGTSPGGGEVVATLSAGTEVTKLAAHGKDDLVCFDEPKPGSRHLVGWVSQSALQDAAPPTPPSPNEDEDGGTPPAPPDPPPHKGHHHRPHKGQHRPQQ